MDINTRALVLHKKNRGKIRIESKVPLRNKDDLGLAYTPGVAEPCRVIAARRRKYTTTLPKVIWWR